MKKKVPIQVWFALGNVLLVALLLGLLWAFAADLEKTSRQEERQSFIQNTNTIRLKVADPMETSCRFVQNWTKLARSKDWRLEEIPRELVQDNTDDEVTIQILQMDAMTGASSKAPEKHPFNYYVDYSKYYTLGQELREFAENAQEGEVLVTSAFTNCINAESSIPLVSGSREETWAREFMRFLCQEQELNRMAETKGVPGVISGSRNENLGFLDEIPPENITPTDTSREAQLVGAIFSKTLWGIAQGEVTDVTQAEQKFESWLREVL